VFPQFVLQDRPPLGVDEHIRALHALCQLQLSLQAPWHGRSKGDAAPAVLGFKVGLFAISDWLSSMWT
jgi:hypothetical protein